MSVSPWRKPVVVVDLDGVLATYDEWRGPLHYGLPLPGAQEAMQEMRRRGWFVVVFTTRGRNDLTATWLEAWQMPYSALNSSAHNPPGCSHKPIADVYIDDRNWESVGKPFNWKRCLARLKRVFGKGCGNER